MGDQTVLEWIMTILASIGGLAILKMLIMALWNWYKFRGLKGDISAIKNSPLYIRNNSFGNMVHVHPEQAYAEEAVRAVKSKTTDPNEQNFDHGPRLSDQEYDKRIIALQSDQPPVPTREQDRRVRRQELELAIDHRLGRDFPLHRREALWAIRQRIERKRLRLIFWHLLKSFSPKSLARHAQGLAGYLVPEYAKELSKSELDSFFGAEEVQRPALPIDLDQLNLQQLSPKVSNEASSYTAYVIEAKNLKVDGFSPVYLAGDKHEHAWTPNILVALQFCRKVDAEQYFGENDGTWKIVEHGFCD